MIAGDQFIFTGPDMGPKGVQKIATRSGSTPLAKMCQSKNLQSLWYNKVDNNYFSVDYVTR